MTEMQEGSIYNNEINIYQQFYQFDICFFLFFLFYAK